MSRKIVFIDDLDDSGEIEADAGTVHFGLEGRNYEIDLSQQNRAKLEAALAPFVEAARKSGEARTVVSSPSKARAGSGLPPEQQAAIRHWAKQNGYNPSPRGRIAGEIIAAFNIAQGTPEPAGRAPKRNGTAPVVEFSGA